MLVALAVASALSCRSGGDDSNGEIAPTYGPPAPIGGGPRVEELVFSAEAAMDELARATCDRALRCSSLPATCVRDAAETHGSQLSTCRDGVHADALANCARHVRGAPCDVPPHYPVSCLALKLCFDDEAALEALGRKPE